MCLINRSLTFSGFRKGSIRVLQGLNASTESLGSGFSLGGFGTWGFDYAFGSGSLGRQRLGFEFRVKLPNLGMGFGKY